jgi:hypothetical protein
MFCIIRFLISHLLSWLIIYISSNSDDEHSGDKAPVNLFHLVPPNSTSSSAAKTNRIPFFKPIKCQEISDTIRDMPQYSSLSKPNIVFPGIIQSVMVLNETELQINNVIVLLTGTDWSTVIPLEFHVQFIY